MKLRWIFVMLAVMVVLFQNCSQKVNFRGQEADLASNGGSNNEPGDDTNNPNPTPIPTPPVNTGDGYTEKFKVSSDSSAVPLDMIWIVDNSYSMTDEIAAIRSYFENFLTKLNASTNFRFVLISSKDTQYPTVLIPSKYSSSTHFQLGVEVDSNDAADIVLDALKTNKIPSGFLRASSKKSILFITDDESAMPADTFISKLLTTTGWSQHDVTISAIAGLNVHGGVDWCQAEEGAQYQTMAAKTKGKIYNICTTDWSASITDLINTSVAQATRRFTLSKQGSITEIISVSVQGVTLAKSQYVLVGNILTISDAVKVDSGNEVIVVYK